MQLGFCFCKHCLFFVLFSSPLGLWERAMPANPALRAGPGHHCVTAFCGLQPLFELPLRGSLCGALPLRPDVRRGISLPTSLARVPADPRLPKPIEHTRPRGIHAPGHSFGVIQTMLLVLVNSGLERMGRKNRSKPNRFLRPAAGVIFSFVGFHSACIARPNKFCRRSRCGLNRAYSTPK